MYDNVIYGSEIFLFHITQTSDFTNLAYFITRTNLDGHIADIHNMFIVPKIRS